MNGIVLYRGPSRLDGRPVLCVLTGLSRPSSNSGTGDMLQSWILRADVNPLAAIHTGADFSVCGDCPLRGIVAGGANLGRACYVNVAQAPLAVWSADRRGSYDEYCPGRHDRLLKGKKIRFGSYGDPVAVPYRTWKRLAALSDFWTGYTHQWRQPKFRAYRRLLMASVESKEDAALAQARGWRTFRIGAEPAAGEVLCPKSDGRRDCSGCGACDGRRGGRDRRVSIFIPPHGSPSRQGSFRRLNLL